jgi:hypothetical protein
MRLLWLSGVVAGHRRYFARGSTTEVGRIDIAVLEVVLEENGTRVGRLLVVEEGSFLELLRLRAGRIGEELLLELAGLRESHAGHLLEEEEDNESRSSLEDIGGFDLDRPC